MPLKVNSPVSPYTSDMPKSKIAADSTPMRKNFRAASLLRVSPLRQPASRNAGPDTSSSPMNIVMRSRDEAMITAPVIDASTRK
jgi:hypothetical protein